MAADPITIVLIVFVTIILGIYYYRQLSKWKAQQINLTWPVKIETCPDYWVAKKNGECSNMLNLPTGSCGVGDKVLKNVNFNGSVFKGETGKKQKCNWSKKCKTSWEGIDNLCA